MAYISKKTHRSIYPKSFKRRKGGSAFLKEDIYSNEESFYLTANKIQGYAIVTNCSNVRWVRLTIPSRYDQLKE